MEAPGPFPRAARALAARTVTFDEALVRLTASGVSSDEIRAAAQTSVDIVGREPRYGAALARLAYALAQMGADPDLRAACGVACLQVENFLGNCYAAAQLGAALLAQAAVCSDQAARWRVWLDLCIAWRQLGEMDLAKHALEQARAAHNPVSDEEAAWLSWAAGNLAMRETKYTEAGGLLGQAELQFARLGLALEAQRCLRSRAEAMLYQTPAEAQALLEKILAAFEAWALPFDAERTRGFIALTYIYVSNRYEDALKIHRACASAFEDFDAPFFAALSHSEAGLMLLHLTQFEDGIRVLAVARDCFTQQRVRSEVVRININLATVYNLTYRAHLAIPLLDAAAAASMQRPGRLARCLGSLALSYQLIGQYDRSLDMSQRAIALFEQQRMDAMVAECAEVLAGTLFRLGRRAEAEKRYAQARDFYDAHDQPLNRVLCETHLAEVYLAQSRWHEARAALEAARAAGAAHNLRVNVAECDRLLADIAAREGLTGEAQAHLASALAVYESESLPVQAALCGLSAARLAIARGDIEQAEAQLHAVGDTVRVVLPDAAWQVHKALAECALRRAEPRRALGEYRAAIEIVQQMRAPLPSERLSASFFGERSALFHDTLHVALELRQWEDAVAVSEAAKTTTFTFFLQSRDRALTRQAQSDAFVSRLLERQAELRRELSLIHQQIDGAGPIRQPDALESLLHGRTATPHELLDSLQSLQAEHAEVEETLRVALSGQRAALSPFDLVALRQQLNTRFGERWLCLAYHQSGDDFAVFALSATSLAGYPLRPTRQQRIALEQATSQHPDMRELVYRGTLGGVEANPALGCSHLHTLFDLLIPLEVRPRLRELDQLVIAPAGVLHGLPFQALMDGEHYLIDYAPLSYAPSLHALQLLLANVPVDSSAPPASRPALLVGLADFAGRAGPLPGAKTEIRALAVLLGESARVVWGEAATPAALRGLSADGTLSQHGMLLHFASHGLTGRRSPLDSRLLLHAGELTMADVLDLQLNGALVTLSACESAAGEAGAGDELLNLARVFFYAGAQTLVASVWTVEDKPTVQLMQGFYWRLKGGDSPARALQQTQCALAHAGLKPYQWAAFQVMGCP